VTGKKILLADEANIVVSLEFLLRRAGHAVVVARDGEEALEAIARERPHLALLDAALPRKSGFEVCHAVRADAALRGTRILLVSARGRDTDGPKALAMGADAFMAKPFTASELVDKVTQMLADGNAPA